MGPGEVSLAAPRGRSKFRERHVANFHSRFSEWESKYDINRRRISLGGGFRYQKPKVVYRPKQ